MIIFRSGHPLFFKLGEIHNPIATAGKLFAPDLPLGDHLLFCGEGWSDASPALSCLDAWESSPSLGDQMGSGLEAGPGPPHA